MAITMPITVNKIVFEKGDEQEDWCPGMWRDHVGQFVAVRPVKSIDPEGKTYLGLFLGELNVMGRGVSFNSETNTLTVVAPYGNPAIFVFDLNRVVFGYQSWWEIIENETDLAQITDADIQNTWYVKALQQMAAAAAE